MREILFKLGLFENPKTRAGSERIMRKALDLLLCADVEYLQTHPGVPSIYTPGLVVYRREPIPQEIWKTIPFVFLDGFADCEDLSCARCAELIVHYGIDAEPDFSYRDLGQISIYHIFVRLPDGSIEDPSRRLGMV